MQSQCTNHTLTFFFMFLNFFAIATYFFQDCFRCVFVQNPIKYLHEMLINDANANVNISI